MDGGSLACGEVPCPLRLPFPHVSQQTVEPLRVFCWFWIPGSHQRLWTEPHGEAERGRHKFHVAHEWDRGGTWAKSAVLSWSLRFGSWWVQPFARLPGSGHAENQGNVHCAYSEGIGCFCARGSQRRRFPSFLLQVYNQNIPSVGHFRNK